MIRSPRRPFRLASLLLSLLCACGEAPTKPSDTPPAARFESADNRQLLLAILAKLDALEERAETESRLLYARIDSVSRTFAVGPQAAAPLRPSAGFEVQLCGEMGSRTLGRIVAEANLKGRGLGTVGIHAGGNGGYAGAIAEAGPVTGVITDGRFSGNLTICAKLGAETDLAPSVRSLLDAALAAASGVTTNLGALATNFGMNATRMNAGITGLNSFTMSSFPIGQGAAASVLAGIPLPTELRTLLANPGLIFQRTSEAVQFGLNQICNSPNWPNELAQRVADSCALRNQFPSAQSVLGVLQGLNGLPSVLSQLGTDVGSLCGAVNSMRPASFTIPAQNVSFPAPIGTVTTFPGFSRTLFPGLNSVC